MMMVSDDDDYHPSSSSMSCGSKIKTTSMNGRHEIETNGVAHRMENHTAYVTSKVT
uniref:Uncharacterized protein n=1 Tax=Meloidogyne incognita TaxID=6306 RepID=A0A914KVB1_MELIC